MFADGGVTGDSDWNGASSASVWGDEASGTGTASAGGDGGGEGEGLTIQYSPVIHADNAEGVDRVLRADKERLRKMLEDLLEERELYESVVKYQ